MNENLFKEQYDVENKSKLKKFYEKNRILIFSIVLLIVISIASISFYSINEENKKIKLAENYIKAKIHLENGEKSKAEDILKSIILANNKAYSALSLFLILNENLITDQNELSKLFNHVIENNKYDKEIKNLLIFKKALFQSNFIDEPRLLETTKQLINTETLWKPHALLLLGDYFYSKKEFLKAREFYIKILSLKNLHKELYDQARSQLILINND